MTLVLHGVGISPQVAIGRARVLRKNCPDIVKRMISPDAVGAEIARFNFAIEHAKKQLTFARTKITPSKDADFTGFIDAHLLMLSGSTLAQRPIQTITQQLYSAEWSLKLQCDYLVDLFDGMDDPYLKSRKNDVEQVINRIHRILMGENSENHSASHKDDIIIASDLTPADTLLMHSNGIKAFVTESGGTLSHTAILAKSLNIPAIVGVQNCCMLIENDSPIIIDGKAGVVLINSPPAIIHYYQAQLKKDQHHYARLKKLAHVPSQTRTGRRIHILANIESVEDIGQVIETGAEGVGLLRTELLFMHRDTIPTEEEHFATYRQVIAALVGKPITIRTLDLGADKTFSQMKSAPVSNPALGLRAIRLCLSDSSLFVPQLRAILRASALGPVRLMIPMLTTLQELDSVQKILDAQMQDLTAKNIPFDPHMPIGGMIETPAAALCIEHFAKRLDFVSIGTNDLIQYTFAIDRVDESVNYLFNPSHPSILKLLRSIITVSQAHNTPVCLCGEMAGDSKYTRLLLGLGLTEFSMNPNAILEIKNQINHTDERRLQPLVEKVFEQAYPKEVDHVLMQMDAL